MVKMVDRWGIQNYILEDAHGSLTHILVKPGSAPQELVSTFQLLDTEARFINVTVRDIYVRYRIMIVPEFKQIVRVSGEREIYHHFLTAAMEVGVFPYVYISRTLYLIRLQNGSQVPIGYAIYE